MKVAEVCRKHDISEPTFYACKAKFGGMNVSPSQWSEASVADAHAVAAAARTESELVSGLRSDTLTDGRRFRILAVVDDCTREPRESNYSKENQAICWCCWRGLNSRPPPYQGGALPLSYSSVCGQRRAGRYSPRAMAGASLPPDPLPDPHLRWCGLDFVRRQRDPGHVHSLPWVAGEVMAGPAARCIDPDQTLRRFGRASGLTT
jgi:hypothetical protein